jgi:hypothetical protein
MCHSLEKRGWGDFNKFNYAPFTEGLPAKFSWDNSIALFGF